MGFPATSYRFIIKKTCVNANKATRCGKRDFDKRFKTHVDDEYIYGGGVLKRKKEKNN